jgi:hypothetical protein
MSLTRAQEQAAAAAAVAAAIAENRVKDEVIADLQRQLIAAEQQDGIPPVQAALVGPPAQAAPAAESTAAFKLPPFYEDDPAMWFRQIQGVFRRRNCFASTPRFSTLSWRRFRPTSPLPVGPSS